MQKVELKDDDADDEEGEVAFAAVLCIHCKKYELATAAHRDRDGEWVCDDCWDERMR